MCHPSRSTIRSVNEDLRLQYRYLDLRTRATWGATCAPATA